MLGTINERIKFLRLRHGYTQQEVIKVLGVGKSVYSMYESGERTMSVEVVTKLANLYDVSTDFIIGISNHTKNTRTSSVEQYLTDTSIESITNMGKSNNIDALRALNTLISDEQSHKIFSSLNHVLNAMTLERGSKHAKNISELDLEFDKLYAKKLLGINFLENDISDDILKNVINEIGEERDCITNEMYSIIKMFFMTQIESFIDRTRDNTFTIRTAISTK